MGEASDREIVAKNMQDILAASKRFGQSPLCIRHAEL